MRTGKVSRLVSSFSSAWGLIKPDDGAREVFFSPQALADPSEYGQIVLGQSVQFDEESDRANNPLVVRVRKQLERSLKELTARERSTD
jgi:cold shock CspA family protein